MCDVESEPLGETKEDMSREVQPRSLTATAARCVYHLFLCIFYMYMYTNSTIVWCEQLTACSLDISGAWKISWQIDLLPTAYLPSTADGISSRHSQESGGKDKIQTLKSKRKNLSSLRRHNTLDTRRSQQCISIRWTRRSQFSHRSSIKTVGTKNDIESVCIPVRCPMHQFLSSSLRFLRG